MTNDKIDLSGFVRIGDVYDHILDTCNQRGCDNPGDYTMRIGTEETYHESAICEDCADVDFDG